jgi:hypothetical protein
MFIASRLNGPTVNGPGAPIRAARIRILAQSNDRETSLPATADEPFQEKDRTMNDQISARLMGVNTVSIIQNLKPVLIDQGFARMNANIEQFSYVLKVVALTHLYMELSLPLAAALRAAEADLL